MQLVTMFILFITGWAKGAPSVPGKTQCDYDVCDTVTEYTIITYDMYEYHGTQIIYENIGDHLGTLLDWDTRLQPKHQIEPLVCSPTYTPNTQGDYFYFDFKSYPHNLGEGRTQCSSLEVDPVSVQGRRQSTHTGKTSEVSPVGGKDSYRFNAHYYAILPPLCGKGYPLG